MMNEPARSENAVFEPRAMAPNAVQRIARVHLSATEHNWTLTALEHRVLDHSPQSKVAGIGQLSPS